MILLDFLNTFLPSAAIAAGMWIALRVLRINAATRYAAWWAVLAAMVAMPLWPWHEVEPMAIQTYAPVAPLEVPPSDWFVWIALAWAAFAIYRLLRIAFSYLRLRRIQRNAQPFQLARFDFLRSGIERNARLLASREIASPMAVGFLRPSVILPESLLKHLTPAELDHVLLHELAHIARRDDWTNLAARFAGAVLGLHPVAAFSLARIAKERELACDDWVVAATGDARPYATSLARVFELSRGDRELLATGMTGSQLGDRVEQLLATGRRFTRGASLATLVTMAAVLLGIVVVGAQSPAWVALAQAPAVPPAAPIAPAAPVAPAPPVSGVAPVAPAPRVAPAPPAATAPSSTLGHFFKVEAEVRAIRAEIAAKGARLDAQKAELEARQAELERMRALIQPQQDQLRRDIESLRKQIEELATRERER